MASSAQPPTPPQPFMTDRLNPVTRLHRICQEIGVSATLINAVDRVLRAISGGRARLVAYALVAQPIGHLTSAPLRPSASSRIAEVGPSDSLVQSMPRPAGVLDRRFAARFECLCATVRGEFAGMLWIAREQYDEDEVRCLYVLHEPARSVWDFDVYVAPAHRASRTLGRLWQAADLRLGAQGVQWSFSRIALSNAASLAAHKHLGARRVGTAFFWVIGPLQIAAMSQTPFIHVGFTAGQRPRLKLRLPAAQGHLRRTAAPVDDRFVTQAIGQTEPAALVLGLDSHGLAVARALSRAGVAVYAVEKYLQNPGVRTRYVERVFPVADYTADHLMPALALARRALAMHGKM